MALDATPESRADDRCDRPPVAAPAVRKSTLREYAEALAVALLLVLLIRGFIVQAFKIPSGSMLPTLLAGDHLLVNKLRYGLQLPIAGGWLVLYSQPQPGDVVVFAHPKEPDMDYIKRVIAVEGEEVEIRDKQIFVNGKARDVPYACFVDGAKRVRAKSQRDNFGPAVVPPGRLFVLGDNRDHSYDSRYWGFVDVDQVKGKASVIYWSWDDQDQWVRWERVGSLIR